VSRLDNGVEKRGYIDKTGKIIVEPQFTSASPFSEGLAYVEGADGAGFAWAYIDATGAFVWKMAAK
jgi:hypothetical protein